MIMMKVLFHKPSTINNFTNLTLSLQDNCPHHANSEQYNNDGDLLGNICDNCPFVSNSYQADIDEDGIGDVCDKDIDGDGKMVIVLLSWFIKAHPTPNFFNGIKSSWQ